MFGRTSGLNLLSENLMIGTNWSFSSWDSGHRVHPPTLTIRVRIPPDILLQIDFQFEEKTRKQTDSI